MKTNLPVAWGWLCAAFLMLTSTESLADVQLAWANETGVGISLRQTPGSPDGLYNVYIGLILDDGSFYMRGNSIESWSLYTHGPFPVAGQFYAPLPGKELSVVVTDVDPRKFPGAQIFTAYGRTDDEMLTNGSITKVYQAPLRYTDVKYGLMNTYPVFISKTGWAKVANKTPYASLFNCWMADMPLSSGLLLANCQDPSYLRRLYAIHPTRKEITVYQDLAQSWDTTPLASGGVCGWCQIVNYPAGVVWHEKADPNPDHPDWGAWTTTGGETYYIPNVVSSTHGLYLQTTTGTSLVTTWPASAGNIDFMKAYSN